MIGLPLHRGARGAAVADLQRRLLALDHPCGHDAPGRFGPGTLEAVTSFQAAAGLDVDGQIGAVTWQALVEAGYHLGDRQLYHRSPMTRGDDVAELQRQLGSLGFDAGRVDGIFGPATSAALVEFQRNSGLGPDGIFGPESAAALDRLGRGRTAAVNVAHVRELERLRSAPRHLSGRRIIIGEPGGLGALAAALGHELREVGAVVALLDHPDGSHQAREANDFRADVYLGLRVTLPVGHHAALFQAAFFQTAGFESTGGRQLADAVVSALLGALPSAEGETVGRRLPVLRETRMPAVLVAASPPAVVVQHSATLARALGRALGHWAAAPVPRVPVLAGGGAVEGGGSTSTGA